MGEIAIRAQNVSKKFSRHTEKRNSLKERAVRGKSPVAPEFWALRDASFEVERGTTFGIIGHNGSGKSTALKVLTGVYRPTSGLVEVHGRVSALLELGAGFHPELTGRENIRLNGAILGLSRKRIDDAMEEIIDFSGIGEFVESPVKVYSSGMFLRLGFAIAVKMDPEILVVDEIIAVGDEQFQRKCTDYLYKLRQDGCTIVVVSHAMSQIEDMCDNAVWLSHGQVQALGPARDTVQQYLDSVNSEEIASRVDTTNVVPGDGRATGSGEIRVQRVEFVDTEGTAEGVLLAGRPAKIRLHYRAAVDLPRAVFGFLFYTEAGVQVAGRNSMHELSQPLPRGEGVVEFDIPAVPLLNGNYLVTTMISDRSHIFDQRDKQVRVTVRSNDQSYAGTAAIDGRWSIAPS